MLDSLLLEVESYSNIYFYWEHNLSKCCASLLPFAVLLCHGAIVTSKAHLNELQGKWAFPLTKFSEFGKYLSKHIFNQNLFCIFLKVTWWSHCDSDILELLQDYKIIFVLALRTQISTQNGVWWEMDFFFLFILSDRVIQSFLTRRRLRSWMGHKPRIFLMGGSSFFVPTKSISASINMCPEP